MENKIIDAARQYLTFKLKDEIFGVDVAQVREILDYIKITKVPCAPAFMCGVINLRGCVVPVVDMNLKFGMDKNEKTVNTCIVVIEVNIENETLTVGALVDSVQEVYEIEPHNIEPAPKIGTKLKNEFIKGMGKRDDSFIIILDTNKVFSDEELDIIKNAGETSSVE